MGRVAALIEHTLKTRKWLQKDLARKLKVSEGQISKWKGDEHMSPEMEKKLRALTDIGEMDADFVLAAGSPADAKKWERLMFFLADLAKEAAETGYDTYMLDTEEELSSMVLCGSTFDALMAMGVAIPKKFPKEIDVDYESDETDFVENVLHDNVYADTIYKIYKSLNDVWGFYRAYLHDMLFEDEFLDVEGASEMEYELMALAASKIEVPEEFAPKFAEFRRTTEDHFTEQLTNFKDMAFRKCVPLRAELMDLVNDSHDSLGHSAERESLGFNKSQLHPDIYMNELLVGMREIHQVLPAILKKLGMYEDFKLDTSSLHLTKDRHLPADSDADAETP